MVEINNQRKAFLDMLAWSEGTDNGRQKNQKSWLWRHCRRRAIYSYSDHPRKLVTLNQLDGRRGRYQLLPVRWDAYRKQLESWKTSLRKVRTLWHCNRLRSVALYCMIDRGDIRQAIDRYGNTEAAGLVMVSSSIRLTALITAKFKRRARRSRRRLMYEQVTAIISIWLSASSSACHGLLIITVITPLPTRPSATKMPEGMKLANAAITDMQMRQRDVAALDAIHEGVSWFSARWCSAWWCLRRWSSSVAHQSESVDPVHWPPPPPAWIMQPPPTGRHRWGSYLPWRRLITMQKQLEGTQKYINEQCR